MVVRKLFDGFKHMTYKNSTTIESMSTFLNLVWHKFEIITHMHGPQFIVFSPPPRTHATYFLYRSIFLS